VEASRLFQKLLEVSRLFQKHLELLDTVLEVFGVSSVLESFVIVLDYFRSIWKGFGQFKVHFACSRLL